MATGVYIRTKPGYWAGKKRPDISAMRKGIKLSEEHKAKLRQAKLDNPVRYWKGKARPGLHTEEWKAELARRMAIKSPFHGRNMSGANNPCWIEDRTKIVGRHTRSFHDPNYKQWCRGVKNRDGWKCKISNGDCSGRIEAHHILGWKDYPSLRYQLNNGIALCHFHHPRKREEETKLSPYFQKLVAPQE